MMIWWDPTALFKRRFVRTDEGYLYYPRAKGGGKLLSEAEYETLVADYRRWMGGRFKPGLLFGLVMGGCLAIVLFAMALDVPQRTMDSASLVLAGIFVCAALWIHFSPYRLCRNRSDRTPPRTKMEVGRATRAQLPWIYLVWLVVVVSIWLAIAVIVTIDSPSAVSVGSTTLLAIGWIQTLRIAVQKFRDPSKDAALANRPSKSDPPTA